MQNYKQLDFVNKLTVLTRNGELKWSSYPREQFFRASLISGKIYEVRLNDRFLRLYKHTGDTYTLCLLDHAKGESVYDFTFPKELLPDLYETVAQQVCNLPAFVEDLLNPQPEIIKKQGLFSGNNGWIMFLAALFVLAGACIYYLLKHSIP